MDNNVKVEEQPKEKSGVLKYILFTLALIIIGVIALFIFVFKDEVKEPVNDNDVKEEQKIEEKYDPNIKVDLLEIMDYMIKEYYVAVYPNCEESFLVNESDDELEEINMSDDEECSLNKDYLFKTLQSKNIEKVLVTKNGDISNYTFQIENDKYELIANNKTVQYIKKNEEMASFRKPTDAEKKEFLEEDNSEEEYYQSKLDIINIKNEALIENLSISNEEVKELYEVLTNNYPDRVECLKEYLDKEDKMTLATMIAGKLTSHETDRAISSKLSPSEKAMLTPYGNYYKIEDIENAIKKYYGKDIKFGEEDNKKTKGLYIYFDKAKALFVGAGGGGEPAEIKESIIDYNETLDEVSFVVLRAYQYNMEMYDPNDDNYKFPIGIYNSFSLNKDGFIYKIKEEFDESFKFTKQNQDNFEKVKYTYKKNEEDKFVLSSIENLNLLDNYKYCK